MITTSEVIALGASFAALALFGAGQLFEITVQFFDLPAHVTRVLSGLRSQCLIWAIDDQPVNVAVCYSVNPLIIVLAICPERGLL